MNNMGLRKATRLRPRARARLAAWAGLAEWAVEATASLFPITFLELLIRAGERVDALE
mgnify:CR=1 FL=1